MTIKSTNKILNIINIEEADYCHICCNESNHIITIKTIRIVINDKTIEFEGIKTYCDICGNEKFIIKYIKENINISKAEYIKQKYKLLGEVWERT